MRLTKPSVKISEAILTAPFQGAKEQRKPLLLFVNYEENISSLRWETRQARKMFKTANFFTKLLDLSLAFAYNIST